MSPKYSIESALPYNVNPSRQGQAFEDRFKAVVGRIQEGGFVRTLLIDDVTSGITDPEELAEYASASVGRFADVVVMRESMLAELAGKVYEELSPKLSPAQLVRLKNETGFSGSFYIAVWTLVRLGYLEHPQFSPNHIAERIINILPKYFQEGEEESLRIIRMTQFPQAADQVGYEYVEEE